MMQKFRQFLANQRWTDWWYWSGILALVCLKIELVYFSFWQLGFVAPPGDDPINHLQIIERIERGTYGIQDGYPPAFHYLVIGLSHLLGQTPYTILTYGTPALIVLSGLAVIVLATTIGGKRLGLITGSIYILTSVYPLSNYFDGNYPDILAAAVLFPLLIAFLIRYLRHRRRFDVVGFGLLLLLIIFTHHLTTAWVLVVLLIYGLVLFGRWTNKPKGPKLRLFLTILGGCLLLAAFLLWPNLIRPLLLSAIAQGGFAKVFGPGVVQPLFLGDYHKFIGDWLWPIGTIGFLWLVLTTSVEKEVKWFILIWASALFLMSRTAAVGLPARFVRELSLPWAILAGLLINSFLSTPSSRLIKLISGGLFAWLLLVNTVQLTAPPFLPDGFQELNWFTKANATTAQQLMRLIPIGSPVVTTPSARNWAVVTDRDLHPLTKTEAATAPALEKTINYLGAQYILYIPLPATNPSGDTYPLFAGYDVVRAAILADPHKNLIARFDDGTELYQVRS